MNSEKYLAQWQSTGIQKQLLLMLIALLKANKGTLTIPLTSLEDIDEGETLSLSLEQDAFVLRYSPEHTQYYTIQETQQWPKTTPVSPLIPSTSRVLDDAAVVAMEDKMKEAEEIRRKAREKRSEALSQVEPWKTEKAKSQ